MKHKEGRNEAQGRKKAMTDGRKDGQEDEREEERKDERTAGGKDGKGPPPVVAPAPAALSRSPWRTPRRHHHPPLCAWRFRLPCGCGWACLGEDARELMTSVILMMPDIK